MKRRWFFTLLPAGLFGWRWHLLGRHECANGGMLLLVLRGEPYKLTARERELVDLIVDKMSELEPQMMQRRLPKS